jgi:hypothetical protein
MIVGEYVWSAESLARGEIAVLGYEGEYEGCMNHACHDCLTSTAPSIRKDRMKDQSV